MKKYINSLGADVPSSIVVFLIAIPLCLGISVASGLSEFSGLVGGIVGGIVIGLLSGSHLSVSGPAAGLTAIVAAAVLKLPAVEAFFLAVVIAGVLQIIMGFLKMGVIGDYIPNSVIKGMLAAIGIILILKQIPYLVGYENTYTGDETFKQTSGGNTFSSIFSALNQITPVALIIGLVGLAILMVYETKWIKSKKVFQLLSGPLVVVVIAVLICYLLQVSSPENTLAATHLVNIPSANTAAEFFSFFRFPDWSYLSNSDVWVTGFTLAMVASLETLLGIEAVDKLDKYKRVTPSNRELLAQGSGNIVSGLLGGLPLTSVIVRSSANLNAGAKSKMSAVYHGILILLCVAFFPVVLNLIPKAALAAILIFTGYKLTKISFFKEFYKKGWDQFMPFMVTITAILLTDLLKGVLIGLGFAIFFIIRSNFRTALSVKRINNTTTISLRKDISFFSKPTLKAELEAIEKDSKVVIDMTKAEFVDKDIMDTVEEFMQHAPLKNIDVEINRLQLSTTMVNKKLFKQKPISSKQYN